MNWFRRMQSKPPSQKQIFHFWSNIPAKDNALLPQPKNTQVNQAELEQNTDEIFMDIDGTTAASTEVPMAVAADRFIYVQTNKYCYECIF